MNWSWTVLGAITVLSIVHLATGQSVSAKLRNEVICERKTAVISCPATKIIQVKKAFYGRHHRGKCGTNRRTNCEAAGSFGKIKKKCSGKSSCSLRARNAVFTDPCKGVPKYIFVDYHCVPSAQGSSAAGPMIPATNATAASGDLISGSYVVDRGSNTVNPQKQITVAFDVCESVPPESVQAEVVTPGGFQYNVTITAIYDWGFEALIARLDTNSGFPSEVLLRWSFQSTVQPSITNNESCSSGYYLSSLGICTDIDECNDKPCGIGWCINTEGSYNCTCPSGTQLNAAGKCEDINECSDPTMCIGGTCVNFMRTYGCYCNKGYHFDLQNRTCVDFDECAAKLDICHINADCTNLKGHYKCSCKNDFEGDGIIDCRLSAAVRSSFNLTCEPNLMKISIASWIVDVYGAMTLEDKTCTGMFKTKSSGDVWEYAIRNNLAKCGNTLDNNETHFIYSNVLTNNASLFTASAGISSNPFEISWRCIFKTTKLLTSLGSAEQLMGAGYVDFPMGLPDQHGNYPHSSGKVMKPMKGGILAQTESPGGALVTDASGAVVPVTNPDGSLASGPEGGRFTPVTDASGSPVTNAQGNVVAVTDSNGAIATQDPPLLLPELDGSSLDPNVYGGSKVPLTKEFSSVLEAAPQPGGPVLPKITLPDGSVVIPGMNYTLSVDVEKLMPSIVKRPGGGIYIEDVLSHKFINDTLVGHGQYELKMILFTDATFKYPQLRTVFTTNDKLYLRAAVMTTDPRITAVITKCWGTPDHTLDGPTRLSLVEEGCESPNSFMEILSNGESRTADVQTKVFKFDGRNETFIHCEINLCDRHEENCEPQCSDEIDLKPRRRRSTDGSSRLNNWSPRNVTVGPFNVLTPEGTQNFVIPAILFIVLVGLIIVLIATLLCCRKRRQQQKKKQASTSSFENETMLLK